MTPCPIFSAASYIEAVCKEANHLADQIQASLAEGGWDIEYDGDFSVEEDHSVLRFGYNYGLRRMYKGQRKTAELFLHFDLFRPATDGSWDAAKTALLVVGYSPLVRDGGWSCEELSPADNGQLNDADVRRDFRPALQERLLISRRPEGASDYARRPWLFALKLSEIVDLEASNRMVVEPLRRLITSGAAEEALEAANAVQWPEQEA